MGGAALLIWQYHYITTRLPPDHHQIITRGFKCLGM